MRRTPDPFRVLLFAVAGWMNHPQQQIIDYLREENRILHADGCPRHGRQYPEEHGIDPAPERNRETSWREFLSRHWELLVVVSEKSIVLSWAPRPQKTWRFLSLAGYRRVFAHHSG